jgi:1,3-beta-galactosyl-N-acetylhexosamine phosphorylase
MKVYLTISLVSTETVKRLKTCVASIIGYNIIILGDMSMSGRITLPAQTGMEQEIIRLSKLWGVDAVRDSDGTMLDKSVTDLGFEIYSTLCLIREDNEWAKNHRDCLQQSYLMSEPRIATDITLEIDLMNGFYKEQFEIDTLHDPAKWWEVYDRSDGRTVLPKSWRFDDVKGSLTILNAEPFHKYTVAFLTYQIWEPVSMYNHKSNGWTSEHRLPVDPRQPKAHEHLLSVLKLWLEQHDKTDVVRFTTFCYNFDLIYDNNGHEKHVDWFGYSSCVSPLAIEQFEKEYGYRLNPEFFVNKGYYHSPFLVPTKEYLDWISFNQRFVSRFAHECVDLVHKAGKKAIMFLGDHWAGTEPYGKYFQDIGLDMVVGAAGDGVTTRMITDIPVKATELRFYPYFFPDIFCDGGDPVGEFRDTWKKSRRAILRKPAQRMGFGGYLSLAVKFPDFIDYTALVCDEFRKIHEMTKGAKPYSANFKVYVLNAWGGLRTWMTHQVAHSLWNQRAYSYLGVFEALAGLPFDVSFISFDDIREKGVPDDTGVIINAGDAGTAWSGGDNWLDAGVVAKLRSFVSQGGGFLGIGEPSACDGGGSYFQLSDVFGLERERGFTLSDNKYPVKVENGHFICRDASSDIDYGVGMDSVFPCGSTVKTLDVRNSSCAMAVNTYGKGRSVYFAGLPYNLQNQRLLHRAVFWAASKEDKMKTWFSENPMTECFCYPKVKKFAVINSTQEPQHTTVYKIGDDKMEVKLKPMECCWLDI